MLILPTIWSDGALIQQNTVVAMHGTPIPTPLSVLLLRKTAAVCRVRKLSQMKTVHLCYRSPHPPHLLPHIPSQLPKMTIPL